MRSGYVSETRCRSARSQYGSSRWGCMNLIPCLLANRDGTCKRRRYRPNGDYASDAPTLPLVQTFDIGAAPHGAASSSASFRAHRYAAVTAIVLVDPIGKDEVTRVSQPEWACALEVALPSYIHAVLVSPVIHNEGALGLRLAFARMHATRAFKMAGAIQSWPRPSISFHGQG